MKENFFVTTDQPYFIFVEHIGEPCVFISRREYHEHTVVLTKLYTELRQGRYSRSHYRRKHSLPTVLCVLWLLCYVAEDVVPVEDYAADGLLLVFLLSAWPCNALPGKLGKGWFLVGSLT